MSVVALSPVAPEPPSPMLTSVTPVTPTLEFTAASVSPTPHGQDLDRRQSQDGASSPGSSRGFVPGAGDSTRRSKKPPPLHTGADWKVVLHLPEIETWLRVTSDRVTQLTHSVGQDSDNRHVDVHLVQLKDICEDISDHVEQIHALLETEFSLKLLSYSVNIIVDIRTVQLLWHQLRVSVLVLKERLLQGLQDSNGNFTRQTDILQAFSQDQHQTRLDALTEVDDCGQLTIRCSQDYFSLDCGITAFELSDYSPGDEERGIDRNDCDSSQEEDEEEEPNPTEDSRPEAEVHSPSNQDLHSSLPELTTPSDDLANHNHSPQPPLLPTMQHCVPGHSDGVKRPPYGTSHSTEVSPTQPSLAKRATPPPLHSRREESRGGLRRVDPLGGLQVQAELSRSSPSLVDPPDRSKFWLELESVYPENVSQSYESLQVMNGRNHQRNRVTSIPGIRSEGRVQLPPTDQRVLSAAAPTAAAAAASQDGTSQQMERTQEETHAHSEGESDSSLPSPMREQLFSSDLEASGEESDPRPLPSKAAVWIVEQKQGAQVSQRASPDREHWYGSEEFLALPAQLRKTEMLAMKLESLAQSLPLRPGDSEPDALQDVDDWDLTELNPDWDVVDGVSCVAESGGENSSPLPPLLPYRRHLVGRLSPTSSSDIAPSVGESIESGPLSDLQSEEDEGRESAESAERHLQADGRGRGSLVRELLQDIQSQDKDPDIWRKIECFVQQLDGFILWLQEALESTENWTQPRQELDSLRVYLDTHLSFKLNVDAHSALKENIVQEGRALLTAITCRQSGLKEILHMVSSQWDQLQRQIRRQHGWMLRTLRCVQSRLLYAGQSQELFFAASTETPPCSVADDLKAELMSSQREAQRAALEQMVVELSTVRYPSATSRRQYSQLPRNNNSLQDFEVEYQELWGWLMDMDAMVVDSHQLMMSEEQRHHLFKSSHTELMMMESRKTSLLGRAESLKRSGAELPGNFHCNLHNLTHTWNQLQKILSEHPEPASLQQNRSAGVSALLLRGKGDDGSTADGAAATENRRSALSPLTNSLLEQLETRIKELKAWLRDTELLIFNSCLRNHKDANEQLHSFKSLCAEVRARRRGVSSVLKLCQKLLQQSQSGPMAEVGPEAEQHREALQLLSINLERRWEAIVMQALQWQNRLKRELGEQQVPGNFLEPGLVDLHHISPVPVGPLAPAPDDSWEWDETDLTIAEAEPREATEPNLMHNLPTEPSPSPVSVTSNRNQPDQSQRGSSTEPVVPNNNQVYQVYSLHSVELYRQPQFPLCSSSLFKTKAAKQKQRHLLKSLSKDSSFSSVESLPDLPVGFVSDARGRGETFSRVVGGESERGGGGRGSGQSADSRRSGCESGIASDTGEMETPVTTGQPQGEDLVKKDRGWRRSREEEKRRRHRRGGGGEAVEILINGHGILTPADSDSDSEVGGASVSLETPAPSQRASGPGLSQTSSLESLLAAGVELFPSKDSGALHRSTSLESGLAPCRSSASSLAEPDNAAAGEVGGAERASKEITDNVPGEAPSSGELSRRTLDLLKRLENIQSPLTAKMTRSVSDMTLLSSLPLHGRRIPASPSLGGHHAPLYGNSGCPRRGPPSLINESSATVSLTELSSTEDSSLASEDFAGCRQLLDAAATANANSGCYRRRCHGNSQAGHGTDEADAASLSMVVNVSACTDEDEDDSDLLSSSTLTLTEEELGVRDGEDEEDEDGLSGLSSGDDEDEMEGSYVLGLEDIRSELQSWIRTPRTSLKTELGLRDELQCGGHLTSSTSSTSSRSTQQNCLLNRSQPKERESKRTKRGGDAGEEEEDNRRNRSYISRFVDDVENGNVDCLRRKDEDDEFLREESSVFTKRGDTQREYVFAQTAESGQEVVALKSEPNPATWRPSSPAGEVFPFPPLRSSSLVGQLQGELPCHSTALPSPPSLSPVDDRGRLEGSGGRKAITIQEKFKFSSFVTEETKMEVRDKDTPLRPKKQRGCHASCPAHLHSSSSSFHPRSPESKEESVHDFVMEIIDMTSLALKSKESDSESGDADPEHGPASLTHIRDKVLEHSHRPLHLRKGDFYSYLSLSSHDSDCGEVSQCSEDKSYTPAPYAIPAYVSPTQGLHSPSPEMFTSTRQKVAASSSERSSPRLDFTQSAGPQSPSLLPSPDIRDEETLFAACTEEVYLGPPLCYSMALSRKQRTLLLLKEKPGAPSEESMLDQELLYFQGSSPTQKNSLPPLLDPSHSSATSSSASPCSSQQTARNAAPPPPPGELYIGCQSPQQSASGAEPDLSETRPLLQDGTA